MEEGRSASAQLYLLYLSLTAVGVVVLLATSLYCSVRRRGGAVQGPQYLVEGYQGGYTLTRGEGVVRGGEALTLTRGGLARGELEGLGGPGVRVEGCQGSYTLRLGAEGECGGQEVSY